LRYRQPGRGPGTAGGHGQRRQVNYCSMEGGVCEPGHGCLPVATGPSQTGRSSSGYRPSCANAFTSTRTQSKSSFNILWTPAWSTTTTTDRTLASSASPPSPTSLSCQLPCRRQHLARKSGSPGSHSARASTELRLFRTRATVVTCCNLACARTVTCFDAVPFRGDNAQESSP